MINLEEKPGRLLHVIQCHHHTRFGGNTAIECLFFVLLAVCESRSQKGGRHIKFAEFAEMAWWQNSKHNFLPGISFSLKSSVLGFEGVAAYGVA